MGATSGAFACSYLAQGHRKGTGYASSHDVREACSEHKLPFGLIYTYVTYHIASIEGVATPMAVRYTPFIVQPTQRGEGEGGGGGGPLLK